MQKQYNRFVRMLHYVSVRLADPEIKKIPYSKGRGSVEFMLGALREDSCDPKCHGMEETHSSFLGRAWGVKIRSQS